MDFHIEFGDFKILPKDMKIYLLILLDYKDMIHLCRTNKTFTYFCKENQKQVWKKKITADFDIDYNGDNPLLYYKAIINGTRDKVIDEIRKQLTLRWEDDSEEFRNFIEKYTDVIDDFILFSDPNKFIRRLSSYHELGQILIRESIYFNMISNLPNSKFIEDNKDNIEKAANGMYDAYDESGQLYELFNAEGDWYREFLFEYVEVPEEYYE